MRFFIFLFLFVNLVAQDDYSLRVAYGKVTSSDLYQILTGDIRTHKNDLRVLALDGGYLLKEGAFEKPLDIYVKAGLSKFYEDGTQDDIYEVNLYIKAYWNFDFLQNRIRFGFGEGISYTDRVLMCEYLEAMSEDKHYARFLNYLDISLDFDIGKLVSIKELYGTNIGWAIKHRSGIFGLINNVSKGGSNYNTFYLEKNF